MTYWPLNIVHDFTIKTEWPKTAAPPTASNCPPFYIGFGPPLLKSLRCIVGTRLQVQVKVEWKTRIISLAQWNCPRSRSPRLLFLRPSVSSSELEWIPETASNRKQAVDLPRRLSTDSTGSTAGMVEVCHAMEDSLCALSPTLVTF